MSKRKGRRSRLRHSAQKAAVHISTEILKKDTEINGKKYDAGTRVVGGAHCSKCGQFYPGAMRVSMCNKCGYRSKSLKSHEIKKKKKKLMKINQMAEQKAKEEMEQEDTQKKEMLSLEDQGMKMRPIGQEASGATG